MGSTYKAKSGRVFLEYDWKEPTSRGLRMVRHYFIDDESVSKQDYIRELEKERNTTNNQQV